MKIEKGKIIYMFVIVVQVILALFPSSTLLFNLEIIQIESANWYNWLPDICSLIALILGYVLITLFYTKRSKYRMYYPLLAFAVVMFWTMMAQMK